MGVLIDNMFFKQHVDLKFASWYNTGKQYHSHAATIYKWAQEDAAKGKAAPKQGIPDYSCKEGESL